MVLLKAAWNDVGFTPQTNAKLARDKPAVRKFSSILFSVTEAITPHTTTTNQDQRKTARRSALTFNYFREFSPQKSCSPKKKPLPVLGPIAAQESTLSGVATGECGNLVTARNFRGLLYP